MTTSKWLAMLALVFIATFALIVLWLHQRTDSELVSYTGNQRYPYKWWVNFLSEFARTQYAPQMTACFFLLAGSAFATSGALATAPLPFRFAWGAWCVPLCLVLAGMGVGALGIFPTDLAFGREPKSPIGAVHNPLSTLSFAPIVVAALLLIFAQTNWHLGKQASIGAFIGVAVCVGASFLYVATHEALFTDVKNQVWFGLMQRAVAFPIVAWLAVICAGLLRR